jgi:hypothetical protein
MQDRVMLPTAPKVLDTNLNNIRCSHGQTSFQNVYIRNWCLDLFVAKINSYVGQARSL